MDETINNISVDEMWNIDLSWMDFSVYENMDFSTTWIDASMMLDPSMTNMLWTLWAVVNILGIVFYLSGAYWLYLINKKLWEEHAWLSFIPIIQLYNYFTASKKSPLHYLIFPIIALIIWIIVWGIISMINPIGILVIILSYIYFLVMWIKLLHAISIRTWNWAWTTVWFIFVSFIMFPIVWMKMTDKSEKPKLEENKMTTNEKEVRSSIEL